MKGQQQKVMEAAHDLMVICRYNFGLYLEDDDDDVTWHDWLATVDDVYDYVVTEYGIDETVLRNYMKTRQVQSFLDSLVPVQEDN